MELNLSTFSIAPRFVAAVRAVDAAKIVALSSQSLEKAQEKAKEWSVPTAYGDITNALPMAAAIGSLDVMRAKERIEVHALETCSTFSS